MTNCPNCGARIVPNHVGTLICDYCGSYIGVGGIPVEPRDDMITIPLNLPKEHAEWYMYMGRRGL